MSELQYTQTMDHQNKNEQSRQKKMWRNFKYTSLSEGIQPKKTAHYVIPTIWHSRKGKTMEITGLMFARDYRWGREG